MASARTAFCVREGSVSLRVYPYRATYWRFRWWAGHKWRHTTRSTREKARQQARRRAREIARGEVDLATLDACDKALVRRFLELRPTHEDLDLLEEMRGSRTLLLSQAVDQFEAHKKGERETLTKHQLRTLVDLRNLCAFLGDEATLARVTPSHLSQWLDSLQVGPKRRNDCRAACVALWRWARSHDLLTARNLTAPEKVPRAKVERPDIRILAPAELKFLFTVVSPSFRPWLALCAFSGLRTGEIRDWHKPPLRWEQIGDKYIDLRADQSKVGKRRLIPVLPALKRHLQGLRCAGEIIPKPANIDETGKLGRALDEHHGRETGWPSNCLRHSYGSHRVAVLRDVPAVAIEMGNSVPMIERHYLEAVPRKQGLEWFRI